MPEVDDDQLAGLRRLRAAFGPIAVVKVLSNNLGDDLAATPADWFEAGTTRAVNLAWTAQKESANRL